MGELVGNNQVIDKIKNDHAVKSNPGKIATDVKDIFADGEKLGLPVFDVSKEEFFNNIRKDRKKIRFKVGSPAQQYMAKTRYNRPFFIRNSEDGYLSRIKWL